MQVCLFGVFLFVCLFVCCSVFFKLLRNAKLETRLFFIYMYMTDVCVAVI